MSYSDLYGWLVIWNKAKTTNLLRILILSFGISFFLMFVFYNFFHPQLLGLYIWMGNYLAIKTGYNIFYWDYGGFLIRGGSLLFVVVFVTLQFFVSSNKGTDKGKSLGLTKRNK